ncbi:hypothetical protein [Paenibacillus alginolyticus]|uniref:hypothetical protein n=1 Tax=Paenibacillus alginolyticus TaxID=59839 RepID=UPI0035E44E99
MDGTGVSGILCNIQGGSIYLIEYLYHTQFATKHYAFNQIRDSRSRNALSLNRLCTKRNLYISLKRRLVKKIPNADPQGSVFSFCCLGLSVLWIEK